MRFDGVKTWTPCKPSEATHLMMERPGPFRNLLLPVMIGGTRAGTPNWTWNGSVTAPTLRPSVLTKDGQGAVCHSWITDGRIQFLDDCTHELRGQTLELLEVNEGEARDGG